MPRHNQVVPATPGPPLLNSRQNTNANRKVSAPRRLLRLMDSNMSVSAHKLRAALSYKATETAVWDMLQALFHAEYLLIAEYIDCALPLLYALYLLALSQLPVARYYAQTAVPFNKLVGSSLQWSNSWDLLASSYSCVRNSGSHRSTNSRLSWRPMFGRCKGI